MLQAPDVTVDAALGDSAFEDGKQVLGDALRVVQLRVIHSDEFGDPAVNGGLVAANDREPRVVARQLGGSVEKAATSRGAR